MHITFSASSNITAFVQRMEQLCSVGSAGPMQDAALNASDAYMQAMRERFVSASAGDGTWEPLAEATLRQHERQGVGDRALYVKGDLEASLDRGAPNHVLEVTDSGVIEGTSDPKAAFQHYGTSRGIPARPILVQPESDTLEAMKQSLVDGLREAVQEAGK